jgi:hypothetical protein
MESNFLGKNKIGVIATLFLIIFLSQHKSFYFLIHTILGRLILVFLILSITSSSILFGVLAVLFVIIMIYKDDGVYFEGFNSSDSTILSSAAASMPIMDHPMTGGNKPNGKEGFNILDNERNLQKGKSSKHFNNTEFSASSSDDVEPSTLIASSPASFTK